MALKEFIISKYKDKYPIIIDISNSGYGYLNILISNIKQTDITLDVINDLQDALEE